MDPRNWDHAVDGVEREELRFVLVPGIDSTEVVLVGSDVLLLATWACSTVSPKFSPCGCTSTHCTL